MRVLGGDPAEYLRRLGEAGDGQVDIARAAVMLAALDHPSAPREVYAQHLDEIADTARSEGKLVHTVEEAARMISALMTGRLGYEGDRISYDDPRNADMMAVIDRRRGLPVALGILYLHAARAAGFSAHGLHSPGHFLLSLRHGGREALVDPFNGGAAIERERLGVPPRLGAHALRDVSIMEPVSDVDVLLRLLNNVRSRALDSGEHTRALAIAERMTLIAPQRADLWLELAHLHEASGALGAARRAYETCLGAAKPGQPIHNEAALGLNSLKRRLN